MAMSNKYHRVAQPLLLRCAFLEKYRISLAVTICFALPAIIIIGAYIYMSVRYDKLWLFNTIVHERGKYTLLEVIFYFRHFLWEVPIKILYSLFVVGICSYYGSPTRVICDFKDEDIPVRKMLVSGALAIAIVLLSIFMTAYDYGFREAIAGLFQYRVHELRPLKLGSHWRNHFLSSIVFFSASAIFVLLYRILSQGGYWIRRRFSILYPVSVASFIFFTFFFGVTMDPFKTPSYLGHQLREIYGTDIPITMFLMMGIILHLENKYYSGKITIDKKARHNRERNFAHLFYWSIPAFSISLFLIAKVLSLDVSGEINQLGNTQGWSVLDLFAWHFFEHSLDYVFGASLVYSLYLSKIRIELKGANIEK